MDVSVSGGGNNECLEELRLGLQALGANYQDMNVWIYD